jgi:hypothetical protein
MRANVLVLGAWSVLMSACHDATNESAPGVAASAKGVASGLSLTIPAPTAESEVAFTLRPGDPFLFQGRFFSVKGATPKAIRSSTPVVRTGDVLAIQSRRGEVRYTAAALSDEGQLLVIPQEDAPDASAVFAFGDGLISSPGAVSECLQQLSTESTFCIVHGGDSACCLDQYDAHWSACLRPRAATTDYGSAWAGSCDTGGGVIDTGVGPWDDTGGPGGGDSGVVGPWDDTGTDCGSGMEEVTDEEVVFNGEECTYSGPVHRTMNEDGECVTTIDPKDGGTFDCDDEDDSGSGGGDTGGAANFPIVDVAGAG